MDAQNTVPFTFIDFPRNRIAFDVQQFPVGGDIFSVLEEYRVPTPSVGTGLRGAGFVKGPLDIWIIRNRGIIEIEKGRHVLLYRPLNPLGAASVTPGHEFQVRIRNQVLWVSLPERISCRQAKSGSQVFRFQRILDAFSSRSRPRVT